MPAPVDMHGKVIRVGDTVRLEGTVELANTGHLVLVRVSALESNEESLSQWLRPRSLEHVDGGKGNT